MIAKLGKRKKDEEATRLVGFRKSIPPEHFKLEVLGALIEEFMRNSERDEAYAKIEGKQIVLYGKKHVSVDEITPLFDEEESS